MADPGPTSPGSQLLVLGIDLGTSAEKIGAGERGGTWPRTGLPGLLPTRVCSGAQGPLGRAITWKDARADGPTSATIDPTQRRALYERPGGPVDGRYPGPTVR